MVGSPRYGCLVLVLGNGGQTKILLIHIHTRSLMIKMSCNAFNFQEILIVKLLKSLVKSNYTRECQIITGGWKFS